MKCVTKSMSGHGLQAYIWKTPLFPLTKSMMDPLLGPVYFNPQMKIQRGQQHALFITLIFAIIPVWFKAMYAANFLQEKYDMILHP